MIRRTEGRGLRAGLLAVALLGAGVARAEQHVPLTTLSDWKFYHDAGYRALIRGDLALAEGRFRKAIEVLGPFDTADSSGRRLRAGSYCGLARTLSAQKRYADAEPLARWALSVREAQAIPNPDTLYQCLYTLALIDRGRLRFAEAEAMLTRALALQQENLGADHLGLAATLDELSGVYRDQRKYAAAEAVEKKALAIREKALPATHPDLAANLDRLAALLRTLGRGAEAEAHEARARALRDDHDQAGRDAATRPRIGGVR